MNSQVKVLQENSLSDLCESLIPKIKPKQYFNYIIGLTGDLGSGKTTFTRLLVKKLAPNANFASPSFFLYKQYLYQSQKLIHIDAYRCNNNLEQNDVLKELLLDKGVIFIIEWIDKLNSLLQELKITPNMIINFDYTSDFNYRKLEINYPNSTEI